MAEELRAVFAAAAAVRAPAVDAFRMHRLTQALKLQQPQGMVFEYFASRRGERGRSPIHVNDSCPELVQSPPPNPAFLNFLSLTQ